MTDTYIDYKEMEIYGDHTVIALAKIESLNPGVVALQNRLQDKIDAVKTAKGTRRDTTDSSGGSREGRDALQGRVVRSIRSLKSHIDSINNDEDAPDIDLTLFFEGGVLGDLAKSTPAQVLLKAEYALGGFDKCADFSQKKRRRISFNSSPTN
jgi:hypothetical protein